MNKILLAVNESQSSDAAAEIVRGFLQAYPRTEVVVLYVTEMMPDRTGYSSQFGMRHERELAFKIQEKLRTTFFKNLMQRVTFEHKQGLAPSKVICQTANEHGCDLIVVGCEAKRRWFRKLISGSVSDDVLIHANVPVLLARRKPDQMAAVSRIAVLRR